MNLISPKNWKTVKLGDITSKMFSGGTPSTQNDGYYGGDIPWLRTQEVNFNYIYDTDIKITKEGFEGSSAKWVPTDSVIVAMYGNSAGRVAYSTIPLTTNQACCNIVVDPEKTDAKFLYFALLKDYIKLENMATGGAQQNLSVGVLKDYEIQIPETVEDQREIAAILGSLDDKIELLRRENKTLESIAQTLFREWVVEFRFPGYEGVKVDGVPEGWKVGKLGDVLKLPSGFAFKSGTFSKDGKYRLVTITNVKNGYFESKTAEGVNELPKNMPEYCRLGTGDILLSLTGEVGRVCIVIGENYVLNQRVSKIEPLQSRDKAFVYFLMRSKEISDQMQSIAVGAVQQNLSPVKALDIETIVPGEKYLQLFSETTSPMFDKLISNIQEIQTLSRLRDDLLNKIFNV